MNFKIIQLGDMHLDDCIELDQVCLNGLWTKSQWERELIDPNRICIGTIEVETQRILGLCSSWLLIDEIHITFIAVHPSYQRKGIGKFLLSELIKRSRSQKSNQIYLEVKETNHKAKAFYKSMGFRIIGNRSNFYKDGSNAVILKKQLNLKS